MIDGKAPDSHLEAMGMAGMRGSRLNLVIAGEFNSAAARQRVLRAADRIKSRHWHVQIYTTLAVISGIKDGVRDLPTPVVFDHFGGAQAALGLHRPGFADLLELVRSGKAYVKISGAHRTSKLAPDYPDVVPLARALIAANADRVVSKYPKQSVLVTRGAQVWREFLA